jgi:hypothetical protein
MRYFKRALIRAFGVNSIVDYLFRWLGLQCSEEFRVEQAVKSASADEPEMPPQGDR